MLSTPLLLRLLTPKASVGNNAQHFTNVSILNPIPNLDRDRKVPRPHSLHQEQVLLPRRFNENLRLRSIHRESLLTEDILPMLQSKHHVLEMVRVRGRNVDDVHVLVFDKLFV